VRCRISGSPARPSPLEATARRSVGRSPSESPPTARNGKAVQQHADPASSATEANPRKRACRWRGEEGRDQKKPQSPSPPPSQPLPSQPRINHAAHGLQPPPPAPQPPGPIASLDGASESRPRPTSGPSPSPWGDPGVGSPDPPASTRMRPACRSVAVFPEKKHGREEEPQPPPTHHRKMDRSTKEDGDPDVPRTDPADLTRIWSPAKHTQVEVTEEALKKKEEGRRTDGGVRAGSWGRQRGGPAVAVLAACQAPGSSSGDGGGSARPRWPGERCRGSRPSRPVRTTRGRLCLALDD
jgi:hypothetical protein